MTIELALAPPVRAQYLDAHDPESRSRYRLAWLFRCDGWTWERIGDFFGITKTAAKYYVSEADRTLKFALCRWAGATMAELGGENMLLVDRPLPLMESAQ